MQSSSMPGDGAIPSNSSVQKNTGSLRTDFAAIVVQIQADEAAGFEQLYSVFNRGIRYYLCRQLGPHDLEDRIHDILLIVVQAIRKGSLREPERLMGFVRTVTHRQVAAQIENRVHTRQKQVELDMSLPVADRRRNPEEEMMIREKTELMKRALASMSARNREILERYYLLEQTQEQICREMSLTPTQFRLVKSRAKAAFGEIGQKQLNPRRLESVAKFRMPLMQANQQ